MEDATSLSTATLIRRLHKNARAIRDTLHRTQTLRTAIADALGTTAPELQAIWALRAKDMDDAATRLHRFIEAYGDFAPVVPDDDDAPLDAPTSTVDAPVAEADERTRRGRRDALDHLMDYLAERRRSGFPPSRSVVAAVRALKRIAREDE